MGVGFQSRLYGLGEPRVSGCQALDVKTCQFQPQRSVRQGHHRVMVGFFGQARYRMKGRQSFGETGETPAPEEMLGQRGSRRDLIPGMSVFSGDSSDSSGGHSFHRGQLRVRVSLADSDRNRGARALGDSGGSIGMEKLNERAPRVLQNFALLAREDAIQDGGRGKARQAHALERRPAALRGKPRFLDGPRTLGVHENQVGSPAWEDTAALSDLIEALRAVSRQVGDALIAQMPGGGVMKQQRQKRLDPRHARGRVWIDLLFFLQAVRRVVRADDIHQPRLHGAP